MIDPTKAEHPLLLPALASSFLLVTLSGSSCIIPDHGIVALVDCGARWCATADFAEALNEVGDIFPIQEPQPDGTSDWVTECICMTPADDQVLQAGAPFMQYELLRNQVLDAARQACLDAAIANDLDPDPPFPLDDLLDPSCYEAVTTVFRDGCCKRLNTECGGINTCDADPDPTEGDPPATTSLTSPTSDSADSTTGEMSSLEPFYAEISCTADTCRIGQPLIDAILAAPEILLAEGTSLRFASSTAGRPLGLELLDVAPDTLAGHLGLRDHDILLRIADLPLTTQAELFEAATFAQSADHLTVLIHRNGTTLARHFVRTR
jgi:hypothetical protein